MAAFVGENAVHIAAFGSETIYRNEFVIDVDENRHAPLRRVASAPELFSAGGPSEMQQLKRNRAAFMTRPIGWPSAPSSEDLTDSSSVSSAGAASGGTDVRIGGCIVFPGDQVATRAPSQRVRLSDVSSLPRDSRGRRSNPREAHVHDETCTWKCWYHKEKPCRFGSLCDWCHHEDHASQGRWHHPRRRNF